MGFLGVAIRARFTVNSSCAVVKVRSRVMLAPLGREIITCCMDNGTIEQYESLIPSQM